MRTEPQHDILVSEQPSQVPYDRDLIRSGAVSRARSGRPQARIDRSAPPRAGRRRSGWRFLATVLIFLLLAAVIGSVVLGLRAATFNASVSTAPFPSTVLLGPLSGTERVNVLLVGYGGEGHDGAFLADSIQVLSIDPRSDTTTTIPIPRDLWIEGVASFAGSVRVNQVFSAGQAGGDLETAGALLTEVVSEVTGVDVEHWLSIDFDGFRGMVDAVGGVTIENPVAFGYTTTEVRHAAGDWSIGHFEAGEIHLDGDAALAYARARYTSVVAESNDFARSVRQARVLAALREQFGGGGIGSVVPGLRLMDAMEGRVRTDLSAIDLFLLSSHLSSDRRVELTEGTVLTATTNTNGAYILVPTGWTGPGAYGSLRAHLASELGGDAP
ncbi:MAG TPA: LCP family protein [Candidatus Binatia bacterium]|nr:LCP family protein [Candidatus Binatia bacterium]